jgi:hypothetical protein
MHEPEPGPIWSPPERADSIESQVSSDAEPNFLT